MSSGQHIDYETLAQEALRGVVRAVLKKVAESGLLGEHHFYIAFNTQAPGVVLSKRLREKYPAEMTIVLQYRFWALEVSEDQFEVKLTFDGIPERLVVPFKAVKVFYDPSVPYGLQFEDGQAGAESGATAPQRRTVSLTRPGEDGVSQIGALRPADQPVTAGRDNAGRAETAERRQRSTPKRTEPTVAEVSGAKPRQVKPADKDKSLPAQPKAEPVVSLVKNEEKTAPDGGAKVFDLRDFRKK